MIKNIVLGILIRATLQGVIWLKIDNKVNKFILICNLVHDQPKCIPIDMEELNLTKGSSVLDFLFNYFGLDVYYVPPQPQFHSVTDVDFNLRHAS